MSGMTSPIHINIDADGARHAYCDFNCYTRHVGVNWHDRGSYETFTPRGHCQHCHYCGQIVDRDCAWHENCPEKSWIATGRGAAAIRQTPDCGQ